MSKNAPTVVAVENVNQAYYQGLSHILSSGTKADTRNGPTIRNNGTLISHYSKPSQRMLLAPGRDANPFFHVFESLWMLAGRRDVAFPSHYVPSMKNFSDDGVVFNAAYGYRWGVHFGTDQIEDIIRILYKDPSSRRVVLQMWDPQADLLGGEKGLRDTACNLLVKYGIVDGELNASVCCRSNDMVLGGYGANAVHFSFLQEYLVDRLNGLGLNVKMGFYEQISMDAHIYTELYADKLWNGVENDLRLRDEGSIEAACVYDAYSISTYKGDLLYTVSPISFNATTVFGDVYGPALTCEAGDLVDFDLEVKRITTIGSSHLPVEAKNPYLKHVVQPMMSAYECYKLGSLDLARDSIQRMRLDLQRCFDFGVYHRLDVEVACSEWLDRRIEARAKKPA